MMAAAVLAACTWGDPGADPYTGPVPAAVEAYQDIPADVRQRLRQRMELRQFDEVATIRRDSIEGRAASYHGLRDMHFGAGRVCRSVDRSAWATDAVERGLVYCEAEHCVIVPTVCRNVSRVTRVARAAAPAGPLVFEAPGAGGAVPVQPIAPAELGRALGLSEPLPAAVVQADVPPLIALAAAPVPAWWAPLPAVPIQPWVGVPPPIPEPGTMLLAALGVAALLWRVRPNVGT